jgi:hypothetical protein
MLNPIAMVKSVGLHLLLGVVALYGGALGMVATPHAPSAPPALKVAGYGGNSAPYLAATSGALTINTTNAWGSSHGGKMIFGWATGHHVALLKKAPKWGVDFRTARRISILRFDADGVIFLRDREVARDKRVLRALASWLRECNVRGNDGAMVTFSPGTGWPTSDSSLDGTMEFLMPGGSPSLRVDYDGIGYYEHGADVYQAFLYWLDAVVPDAHLLASGSGGFDGNAGTGNVVMVGGAGAIGSGAAAAGPLMLH